MCVWRNWQDFGIKQIEASRNKRKNEKKKNETNSPYEEEVTRDDQFLSLHFPPFSIYSSPQLI